MTDQPNDQRPKTEADIQEEPASTSQNKTLKIVLIIVGVFVLLAMLGVAILIWFGATIGEKAIEQATDSSITRSDEGISIETEDGDFAIGSDQELSEDFPKEVPLYSPATITATARSRQADEVFWNATLSTNDSAGSIQSFYENALEQDGWTIESSFETGGLSNLGAINEAAGLTLQLGIISDDSNEETGITINVSQE